MTPTAWIDSPVLFYGSRKAGTTLLQSLFDGSERFPVYPYELKLKYLSTFIPNSFEDLTSYYFSLGSDAIKQSLQDTTSNDYGIEGLDLKAYADHCLTKLNHITDGSLKDLMKTDISSFVNACKDSHAPISWGIKEVGGDPRSILPFFKAMFPNGKVVIILRHPFHVAASILNDRKRRGIPLSPTAKIKESYISWRQLSRYSEIGNTKAHFFTYESLTTDKSSCTTIKKICAYLDIQDNPIFYEPTLIGRQTVVRTASKKESGLHFNSKPSWRKSLSLPDQALIYMGFCLCSLLELFRTKQAPNYSRTVKQLCP